MTKKDMEDKIAEMERKISAQARALEAFAKTDGVEIELPPHYYMSAIGDAPHIRDGSLQKKLIPLMCTALKKHGANHEETGRIVAKAHASMRSGCSHDGGTVTVPRIWGDIMFAILDAAAAFGRECYADGYANGSDMLGRLVAGEVTADQFEESAEREKAIRRQERKDFKNLTSNWSDA